MPSTTSPHRGPGPVAAPLLAADRRAGRRRASRWPADPVPSLLPTGEQIKRLVEAACDTRYGLLFELLVNTGLRRGEALTLKWRSHVKGDDGWLEIRGTLVREDGDLVTTSTKASKSRREVPITARTASASRMTSAPPPGRGPRRPEPGFGRRWVRGAMGQHEQCPGRTDWFRPRRLPPRICAAADHPQTPSPRRARRKSTCLVRASRSRGLPRRPTGRPSPSSQAFAVLAKAVLRPVVGAMAPLSPVPRGETRHGRPET